MGQAKTVILVHGAWADGSSWSRVIPLLAAKGLTAVAVQLPLTSGAYVGAGGRGGIASADGPVVLAGHSYGGVVITEAGADPKVSGLAYIAAFAPDAGESAGSLGASVPPAPLGTQLRPDATGFLKITAEGVDQDFAQDLPPAERQLVHAVQGPTNVAALGANVSTPAWKGKPSWYLIAAEDRAIPPALQHRMAERTGARTTTVRASHLAMLSQPAQVAEVILQATA
jgi:pimeloyl-ACP methyl ester carboxylesterase